MAIGSAIECGSLICVYDEHERTLFQKTRGGGAHGRVARIHRLHRHRAIRFDHLYLRRTRHDDLLKGGVTKPRDHPTIIRTATRLPNLTKPPKRVCSTSGLEFSRFWHGCRAGGLTMYAEAA
jgi:hypothetical protein